MVEQPMVFLDDVSQYPLSVFLASLNKEGFSLGFHSGLLSMIPAVLLFLYFRQELIEGVDRVSGNLTDHYDPKTNVIRLSDSVYDSTSTAAIGVACHEAGHAVQYAENYAPIKVRAAIIPLTNFGSKIAMPLILLGILCTFLGSFSDSLVYMGIAAFGMSLVFQIVTLPVEFNASRRAMEAIESANILTEEEQRGARKTLTAAALTYVAATAVALAQLLRLIMIFGGRRRND